MNIDWDKIYDCGDPRLVLIEGFRKDPDLGVKREGHVWLYEIDHGDRCEDGAGNRFRVMGYGSVQGSVVVRDRNRRMYQADCGIIVKPVV